MDESARRSAQHKFATAAFFEPSREPNQISQPKTLAPPPPFLEGEERKMARKRKPCGDGAVESPGEFANPEDGSPDSAKPKEEDGTMESSAEFAKPVYLVAARDDGAPGYSIFEIDAAAADEPPPRARTVAGLPGAERGMSFVAAHSTHGSWIVGVGGGLRAATIIFDPRTLKTFHGPRLNYPKHKPVLISHRGQVYAISERPRVVNPIDREPWFESLSFNQGVPSSDCGMLISWSVLTPPPFFPCLLNPYEFRNPPEISVTSYAAVGSHILLSPQPELMLGTYAFHVVNKTWEKVHDKNLPFLGQAVHLGGGLFAACPISNNANAAASALVLQMSIKVSSSATSSAPSLLIQEFKVAASEDRIPLPLFCPLGKGSFCCIRLGASCPHRSRRHHKAKEVQVILTVFRMENMDIMTTCQSQAPKAKDPPSAVQVKEQSHICEYKHQFGLLGSDMPGVAALSMDTEIIDLGEETTETRARKATDSTIFEAPVIRYYWS